MRLPTFIIIGAMKSGTTALSLYLRKHPQVSFSRPKEVHFFSHQENWERGVKWYVSHFEGSESAEAIGEGSTSYTKYPRHAKVAERMAQVVPDVRLIYLLRHPVDRMRSQYAHRVLLGKESRPIEEALEDPVYVHCSMYAFQLQQYLAHFPLSQVMVVLSESLRENRLTVLSRIHEFIGVEESFVSPWTAKEFHVTSKKRRERATRSVMGRVPFYGWLSGRVPRAVKHRLEPLMFERVDPNRLEVSAAFKSCLEKLFREDIRELRSIIGDDFHGWGIA